MSGWMQPTVRGIAQVDITSVLGSADPPTCSKYHILFDERARHAERGKRTRQARVYRFLAIVCSMMLEPSSAVAPFKPIFVSESGRSATPEDFESGQIALVELYLDTADPELRSRIADLHWTTKKDYQSALKAIAAYVASADRLAGAGKLSDASVRFDRAAGLAASINRAPELEQVRQAIDSAIETAQIRGLGHIPEELLMVALRHRGDTNRDYAPLATSLAEAEESQSEWWLARRYWETAAAWHAVLKRETDRVNALRRGVETLVNEAATSDSAIAKASFLNQALDLLRVLPDSRQRQEEIKLLALEAQQQFLSEASKFQYNLEVPGEEAEEHRAQIRSFISGAMAAEALAKLAGLFTSPSYDEMRTTAEEIVRAHPFRFAFSSLTLGDNNKVVAKTGTNSEPEKEREANVLSEMYQQAALHRHLYVMATLEPARWQVFREHNPSHRDIAELIAASPVVPPDRLDLVADGILAGLRGDLVHCGHVLIPQFENMLRWVLTMMGKPAFRLTQEGTQEELNLNPLLTNNEHISRFLGRDLLFDLRGLLVEECSTNLRNRLSHGMMTRSQIQQPATAYFWWAVLYVVLATSKK